MALHVPRGIYMIVVSLRLDYCRRDCATSPSWSPAMSYEENYSLHHVVFVRFGYSR